MNEKTARTATYSDRPDDNGAYLGQVRAVYVKRGTAEELAVSCFDDGEGADVFADFTVRAMEKSAVIGVAVDEQMDRFGIGQQGLARAQRRRYFVQSFLNW